MVETDYSFYTESHNFLKNIWMCDRQLVVISSLGNMMYL